MGRTVNGLMGDVPSESDHATVVRLLGRDTRSRYTIATRDSLGSPVVLMNLPVMDDGTPMPTLFWLVGPREVAAVGALESTGAVDEVESIIGLDAIDEIHSRYAIVRDALIPGDHSGPRPSGGVGGTRRGVKCLHAHFAWWLAGGDDAVGEWVATRLRDAGANVTLTRAGGGGAVAP